MGDAVGRVGVASTGGCGLGLLVGAQLATQCEAAAPHGRGDCGFGIAAAMEECDIHVAVHVAAHQGEVHEEVALLVGAERGLAHTALEGEAAHVVEPGVDAATGSLKHA